MPFYARLGAPWFPPLKGRFRARICATCRSAVGRKQSWATAAFDQIAPVAIDRFGQCRVLATWLAAEPSAIMVDLLPTDFSREIARAHEVALAWIMGQR